MKKILLFLIVFYVFIGQASAQNDFFSSSVNRCIAMLGKPVPNGFWRLNRTMFTNEEDIILHIENGIVDTVSIWTVFDTFNEAHEANGIFYNYFENSRNNWKFYQSTDEGDYYLRNNIFAFIVKPSKRDDGKIFIAFNLSRNR